MQTVEGTTAQQCVRKAVAADELGICPCSKRAVSLALATTCFVDHKDSDGKVTASCAGQRACLAVGIDGLAACAAPVPAAEICDGKDNDCDGVTDEVTCDDANPCTVDACSPGAPAAGADGCTHIAAVGQACDDKDPCTTGSMCDKAGACGAGKNECERSKNSDCLAKEDGDACNGSLICDQSALPYKCKIDPASVVVCDASKDTACASNSCEKATGKCALLPKAASTVCDDSDACTVGDNCQNGTCTAGTTICQCQADADCAAKEDGNLCNGTLYCNKTAFPFVCSVNPASLVVCQTGGDSGCAKNTCQPKTGLCAMAAVENGTACDADGNKCTIGDVCQSGACLAGENLCDCKANSDCVSKEDGDLCNGTLFCNKAKGKCEVNPQTVVSCPSANDTACTKSQCDKNSGACKMQAVPDKAPCFDGSLCTTGDVCLAGNCVGSASTCLCQSDADCAGKDDGDLCNGTLFCDKLKGTCQLNPATVVSCPNVNDTVCLANQCEKKSGKCQMTPTKNACEDGNPCTEADTCANGLCQPGANACPCTTTADCKAKDDSNLCNGSLVCNKALGACLVDADTIVICPKDKDTVCQKSICAAATGTCGLYAVNQGVACSDGETCTEGEFCQLGVCSGGLNICPCQADSDCVAKDDGDLCNGVLTCHKELLPAPGCLYDKNSVVACSKANDSPCLQNQCGKTTGLCKMTAVAGSCSDGEPCTVDDYCSEGNCLSGKNACPGLVAADCDDKLACTIDSCDKAKGCSHNTIDGLCDDGQVCTADTCDVAKGCLNPPVSMPCSDGNVCTQTDTCSLGACVGSKPQFCGDGNSCTDDSCDKVKSCVNLPNTATCSDNSVCTLSDACTNTVCKAGAAADCDDGDACTQDQCDAVKGCANTAIACDDKVACTADSCDKQSGCANLPQDASCVDVNPCTDDSCDKAKGCVNLANSATCSDGDACTIGEVCTGKACLPSGKLDCNDNQVCTNDSCDKLAGCVNLAVTVTTSCDDASVCTTVDLCVGGKCAGGVPKVCGDGNPCSTGGCDPKTGCLSTPAPTGAPCSDGDACTYGDGCGGGKCLPGAATVCDDANTCTADSCDKVVGCKFVANTAACSDNNACTTGDICANSACKPGATAVVCDDGNTCTAEGCDAKQGCVTAVLGDGVDCADGVTCTDGDVCAKGVCLSGGQSLFEATFGGSGAGAAKALAGLTDGFALAGSTASKGAGGDDWWVVRTDAQGVRLWDRSYGGATDDRAYGLTVLADGLAMAGATTAKGAGGDDGWLVRTDAFGNTSCANSGGCMTKAQAACDDGNPCTADQCDAAHGGCFATGQADGVACGTGGKVCGAGGCLNAVGCPATGTGTVCGNGQGTCDSGYCFHTDAKGYKWTLVPAGVFWMGCNAAVDSQCNADESPQHQVDLSAYWIGVYEVTADIYKKCVTAGASGCSAPSTTGGSNNSTYGTPGKEQHPVNLVNWTQSQSVCQWLGGDLPTEAQWERAARGGCEAYPGKDCKANEVKYPWGNTTPVCGQKAVYDDASSGKTCGQAYTTYAVGAGSSNGASPCGAYDMAGNVWEWTLDWYDSAFYAKAAATAKEAWNSTSASDRVVRGGSFFSDAASLRSGYRGTAYPSDASTATFGVRCAKPFP